MPSVLLTGARGLVGDSVLRYFHAQGWRIIVACSGSVRGIDDSIATVQFDLGSVVGNSRLEEGFRNVDVVIHCAAILPSSNLVKIRNEGRELYIKNIQGTYDLMEMAVSNGVKTFIYASGTNLYASQPEIITEDLPTSPSTPYLLSKVAGENAAEMFNRTSRTRFVSLRISAPYGARYTAKSVIPRFVTRALAGEPLELLGTGKRQQVFTYVTDIARACMAAINAETSGTYNIAGAGSVTMEELAHAVLRAVGGLEGSVKFTGQPDPNEGVRRRISLEQAKRVLGWEPIYDIKRGLAEMVAEIRNPLAPLLQPAVS